MAKKRGKKRTAKRAKKRSRRAKTRTGRGDRVEEGVELLQSSIGRWSRYGVDAARLASKGDLNPGEWAQKYANMWKGLADDSGKLVRLMFGKRK